MARKRVIYHTEYAYASTTATGNQFAVAGSHAGNNVRELTRLQSWGHSFQQNRQDVNQFGTLAAISREITEPPTVNVDINYLITDGGNDNKLGFNTNESQSALRDILDGSNDERNLYFLTTEEGEDAINNADVGQDVLGDGHAVAAFGNAYLSNFSIDGAIGQLPNASMTFDASNIIYQAGSSGNLVPAVNPTNGQAITNKTYELPQAIGDTDGNEVAALRPGDIVLDLANSLGATVSGDGSAHLQSFSLSVPINREPLDRLGSKYSFSKEISFPVTVTMNVSANVSDITTGSLADLICDDVPVDLSVTMFKPSCAGGYGDASVKYALKNAKLDSQSMSSSIGSNKTVDLTWSAQIGGPQDTDNGLFISGSHPAFAAHVD